MNRTHERHLSVAHDSSALSGQRLFPATLRLVYSRWPEITLVAMVVLFLGDCCFGGRVLALRDFFVEYQPYASRFFRSLAAGNASCWDSTRQCGIPRMAQPAETPFYPPAMLFALGDADHAAVLSWIFHLTTAALGAYALARQWGLTEPAALLAGVTFAFNTYVTCFIEFHCGFVSLAWLPWVILMFDRITTRDCSRDSKPDQPAAGTGRLFVKHGGSIAMLAAALALQLLGIGEYFYYSILMTTLFWAGWLATSRDWRRATAGTLRLAFAGILGLAIALPQLAMTMELLPLSDRSGAVDAIVAGTSAHPKHWLTLVVPFLYGRPGYPAATWAPDIYEIAVGHCYVGLMPLTLAGFAVANLWRRKKIEPGRTTVTATLVVVAVAGLVMAAGKFTPVYSFLHDWLPGLRHFRMPTKFYLFVAFALSMLGGIGLDDLLKSAPGDRFQIRCWRAAATSAVLLGLVGIAAACSTSFLVTFMGHPNEPTALQLDQFWNDYAMAVVFALVTLVTLALCISTPPQRARAAAVAVAVTFLNLLLVSRQLHPTATRGLYSERPVQLGRAIGNGTPGRVLPLNWSAQQWLYGKRERIYWDWARNAGVSAHVLMEGASRVTPNGLGIRRYSRMFGTMMSGPAFVQNRIADMMGVRFVITGPPFADVYWGGATTDVTLVERPDYLPRARLLNRWSVVDDEDAAFATITANDFQADSEAVVELSTEMGASPEMAAPTAEAPSAAGNVLDFLDEGDRVSMTVESSQRSLLVLADTWYPGWSAKVDGKQTTIYRTNYLFRGVIIDAGRHRVEFVYRPRWLVPSLTISGLSVIATAALAAVSRMRARPGANRIALS